MDSITPADSRQRNGHIDLDRTRRIAEIRDGALVRQALGQAATHHRLPDGQHVITLRGGAQFAGATLQEAIEAAKAGRPTA